MICYLQEFLSMCCLLNLVFSAPHIHLEIQHNGDYSAKTSYPHKEEHKCRCPRYMNILAINRPSYQVVFLYRKENLQMPY